MLILRERCVHNFSGSMEGPRDFYLEAAWKFVVFRFFRKSRTVADDDCATSSLTNPNVYKIQEDGAGRGRRWTPLGREGEVNHSYILLYTSHSNIVSTPTPHVPV